MINTTQILPLVALLALIVFINMNEAQGQIQGDAEIRNRVVQIIRNGARQQPQAAPDTGATLKTDPDLEATLEKAERFRGEGQFGIAAKLWQSVLERSGDALFTKDGQIYYSLAQRVENIIASLPSDAGLAAYRIKADANAKELMAEANDPYDERALQLVIRSYFLSSIGDDAALTLSAVYMDKYDFVGAYRLLEKIINRYPDPSVRVSEVQARMAICQAMMGEEQNARKHLQLARDAAGRNDLMLKQVDESIAGMIDRRDSRRSKSGYVMALADRHRSGVMPSLPVRYFSSEMEATWQYYFAPRTTRWADVKRIKPIFGADVAERSAQTVTQKERLMIDRWRKSEWRPSGHLLFDNDKVYFKTAIDLSVWSRNAQSDTVVWRPLWQNRYELDDYTRSMVELRRRLNRGRIATGQFERLPGDDYEVQLFADTIGAQMSIQDGVLYTIEGPRTDSIQTNQTAGNRIRFGVYSRRSRSNHLTAYAASTGKLLWTLPPIEDELAKSELGDIEAETPDENLDMVDIDDGSNESPWIQSGGFMSSPVAYGGLVIVPVNHGGSISIYALDPEQEGKTVWKSYLCDESETGANPYSPVNLSIDGSDLFASCGLGVVFILDPTTGVVRFAKRYERTGQVQVNAGRWGRSYPQIKFESWMSDTVIAYGRQMICFSSDAKHIEAHDRNTGELIWRGESEPEAKVDYLLGVKEGVLYAAGPQTILAFDLEKEGLMIWGGSVLFDGRVSYGRGMLTADAIYLPVENQIIKFALNGKNSKPIRLKTANVNFGTGAPVGNLFSDGKRIWVQGANRVYALGPVAKRVEKAKPEKAD